MVGLAGEKGEKTKMNEKKEREGKARANSSN